MANLGIDFSDFGRLLRRLESLNDKKVKEAVEDALETVSARIGEDIRTALSPQYLPASGRYSEGDTAETIAENERVSWQGWVAEIPDGFDFSKLGAGGYLISGTPRMAPDVELQKILKQGKNGRYKNKVREDLSEIVLGYIMDELTKG